MRGKKRGESIPSAYASCSLTTIILFSFFPLRPLHTRTPHTLVRDPSYRFRMPFVFLNIVARDVSALDISHLDKPSPLNDDMEAGMADLWEYRKHSSGMFYSSWSCLVHTIYLFYRLPLIVAVASQGHWRLFPSQSKLNTLSASAG